MAIISRDLWTMLWTKFFQQNLYKKLKNFILTYIYIFEDDGGIRDNKIVRDVIEKNE